MVKEPVDHILRSRLPWRSDEGAITECGYDATKVKTLTRDEYLQRVKDLGQQRAAMLTCMTCSDTIRRWKTWDDDPRAAMGREVEWEYGWRARSDRGERLKDELIAISELIEAHREEFALNINNSSKRREWLEMKARRKPKKIREPGGL